MASGGGENRLKSYKTKGFSLDESRRKREEEGIVLRKCKRDEQVLKGPSQMFMLIFLLIKRMLLYMAVKREREASFVIY